MRCNLLGLMALSCGSLLLLSGCTNKRFFSIQDLMKAPKLSKTQQKIKNTIADYIGDKIVFKYCEVNDRYCAFFKDEWGNKSLNFCVIAFCKSMNDPNMLHIVFLFKENNIYKVAGEILIDALSMEKIQIKDINNDGKNEMLIYNFSANKDSSPQISIYSYDVSGIFKLND